MVASLEPCLVVVSAVEMVDQMVELVSTLVA